VNKKQRTDPYFVDLLSNHIRVRFRPPRARLNMNCRLLSASARGRAQGEWAVSGIGRLAASVPLRWWKRDRCWFGRLPL